MSITLLPPDELRLPEAALLARLAVSDNGFVLDPVAGASFTLNASGLALLRTFVRHRRLPDVVQALCAEHDLGPAEAERDALEFAALLCEHVRP